MDINKLKKDLTNYVEAGEKFNSLTKEFLSDYESLTDKEIETLKKDGEFMSLLGRMDAMVEETESNI